MAVWAAGIHRWLQRPLAVLEQAAVSQGQSKKLGLGAGWERVTLFSRSLSWLTGVCWGEWWPAGGCVPGLLPEQCQSWWAGAQSSILLGGCCVWGCGGSVELLSGSWGGLLHHRRIVAVLSPLILRESQLLFLLLLFYVKCFFNLSAFGILYGCICVSVFPFLFLGVDLSSLSVWCVVFFSPDM